jgi:hypothetical protein
VGVVVIAACRNGRQQRHGQVYSGVDRCGGIRRAGGGLAISGGHPQAILNLSSALRRSRVTAGVVISPLTRYAVLQELDRHRGLLNDSADTLVLRLVVDNEADWSSVYSPADTVVEC